jgi:hypothetical protein
MVCGIGRYGYGCTTYYLLPPLPIPTTYHPSTYHYHYLPTTTTTYYHYPSIPYLPVGTTPYAYTTYPMRNTSHIPQYYPSVPLVYGTTPY